jgi:hypothetical protein
VVQERSVSSGYHWVEWNASNELSVVTGTGFHRPEAAVWSRRFEQAFNGFFVRDFLQNSRGRLNV